jgi:hypothetical protein
VSRLPHDARTSAGSTRSPRDSWLDALIAPAMPSPRDVNGFCDESGEQTDSHLRATLVGEKVATSRSGEGLSGPTRGWQWEGARVGSSTDLRCSGLRKMRLQAGNSEF